MMEFVLGCNVGTRLRDALGITQEKVRDIVLDVDAEETVTAEVTYILESGHPVPGGPAADVTSLDTEPVEGIRFRRYSTRQVEVKTETVAVGHRPGIGLALARLFGGHPCYTGFRLVCTLGDVVRVTFSRLADRGEIEGLCEWLEACPRGSPDNPSDHCGVLDCAACNRE